MSRATDNATRLDLLVALCAVAGNAEYASRKLRGKHPETWSPTVSAAATQLVGAVAADLREILIGLDPRAAKLIDDATERPVAIRALGPRDIY